MHRSTPAGIWAGPPVSRQNLSDCGDGCRSESTAVGLGGPPPRHFSLSWVAGVYGRARLDRYGGDLVAGDCSKRLTKRLLAITALGRLGAGRVDPAPRWTARDRLISTGPPWPSRSVLACLPEPLPASPPVQLAARGLAPHACPTASDVRDALVRRLARRSAWRWPEPTAWMVALALSRDLPRSSVGDGPARPRCPARGRRHEVLQATCVSGGKVKISTYLRRMRLGRGLAQSPARASPTASSARYRVRGRRHLTGAAANRWIAD